MKKRRIIIPLVCAAGVITAVGIWKTKGSGKVTVIPVSDLSDSGMADDGSSAAGTVYQSSSQSVYPTDSDIIKEVYVKEGDTVKAGDPLMAYDVTSLQLSYAKKQLAAEQAATTLQADQNKLNQLLRTTPTADVPTTAPTPTPTPSAAASTVEKTQTNDAWNVIDAASFTEQQYLENTDGTQENPYVFAVTEDAVIYGSFFNAVKDNPVYVSFRIYADNTVDDTALLSAWTFNTSLAPDCEPSNEWSVLTHCPITADTEAIEEESETTEETADDTAVTDTGESYTAEELAKAIKQQRQTIKTDEIALRRAQLEVQEQADNMSDGIVKARTDGTVTKVCDPDNRPSDGSAFLTVSASGGTVIQTYISELMLDEVGQGTELTVNDYANGTTYTASITSIDKEPAENVTTYSDSNPNVSWYPAYATISEENDLTPSSALDVTIQQENGSDQIILSSMFVRYDNGHYYVMKDDNGKLVRQNVEIGEIYWGSEYEITKGLEADDAIAFPYGKQVKEGALTRKGTAEDIYA